jgi:hypothetical protein
MAGGGPGGVVGGGAEAARSDSGGRSRRRRRGDPRGISGGHGCRRLGRRRGLRRPERLDLLGQRSEADIRFVDLLPHCAHVRAHRVGLDLHVGESLPADAPLLVDARRHGLEHGCQVRHLGLQPLILLLQHADVRHHLLILLAGGFKRPRGRKRQQEPDAEQETEYSHHGFVSLPHPYFAVMTKWARRFFAHAASSWPGSNGNSLP